MRQPAKPARSVRDTASCQGLGLALTALLTCCHVDSVAWLSPQQVLPRCAIGGARRGCLIACSGIRGRGSLSHGRAQVASLLAASHSSAKDNKSWLCRLKAWAASGADKSFSRKAEASQEEPEIQRPPGCLAEVKRQFLRLPQQRWVGPGYELLAAYAERAGRQVPLNLMLDSALTSSMLSPHVSKFLGLGQDGMRTLQTADGKQEGGSAFLKDLILDGGEGLSLGSYSAIVVEFTQSSMGASMGCPVDGMLGMDFFLRFGVEVDSDVFRLYDPDACEEAAMAQNMVILRTTSLPAKLHGLTVGAVGGPSATMAMASQWILGIIDTGSANTVLSWSAAAQLLGITEAPVGCGSINAMGIGGKAKNMPLVNASLQLCSAGGGGPRVNFSSVEVALGDIELFEHVLGDTTKPAVLIGQDLLTQHPYLLAAKQNQMCFKVAGGSG